MYIILKISDKKEIESVYTTQRQSVCHCITTTKNNCHVFDTNKLSTEEINKLNSLKPGQIWNQ